MANEGTEQNPLESLMALSRLAGEVAAPMAPIIAEAAGAMVDCLKGGGKILACGNGGSAADAQHFIGEIIGRFLFDRPSLPGITLSADTSILTAVGNDYGFDQVFSRQVEGLGKAGDVLVTFSTSGTSKNVLRATEAAHERSIRTVAFIGADTNPTLDACGALCIRVPSDVTPRIQEIHTAVMHAICEEVENQIFKQ